MMKRIRKSTLLCLTALLICACNTDDTPSEKSQILLFVIDYETNEMQAGTTMEFEKISINFSEIPVDVDSDPPQNDLDGSVSLFYTATQDKIFEGVLNTEGRPQVLHPPLIPAEDFFEIENQIAFPSYTTIQNIDDNYSQSFNPTWEAINNLGITEIYIQEEALVGRYLYKPSENVSSNWKWIVLLYQQ